MLGGPPMITRLWPKGGTAEANDCFWNRSRESALDPERLVLGRSLPFARPYPRAEALDCFVSERNGGRRPAPSTPVADCQARAFGVDVYLEFGHNCDQYVYDEGT